MKNKSGAYVMPSIKSTSEAAAGIEIPSDFRVSVTNASGAAAYPIAGFTYLLVQKDQQDPAKGKALVQFLWWASHDGQQFAAPLDYSPLPAPVVKKVETTIRTLTVQGKTVNAAGSYDWHRPASGRAAAVGSDGLRRRRWLQRAALVLRRFNSAHRRRAGLCALGNFASSLSRRQRPLIHHRFELGSGSRVLRGVAVHLWDAGDERDRPAGRGADRNCVRDLPGGNGARRPKADRVVPAGALGGDPQRGVRLVGIVRDGAVASPVPRAGLGGHPGISAAVPGAAAGAWLSRRRPDPRGDDFADRRLD